MLLSDRDIHVALKEGRIGLDPFDPDLVQPASVDVRLDAELRFQVGEGPIDPELDGETELIKVAEGDRYLLGAGQFLLGSTVEWVELPADRAAFLVGKSSVARQGLSIEAAGLIDPGFCGQTTLELSNTAERPLWLRPGMKVGQLYFLALTSPAERPYGSPGLGSRYQGQSGPTAARGVS